MKCILLIHHDANVTFMHHPAIQILMVAFTVHLRNESLFFWVHGEWIGGRDKQIAWTAKRFSGDLFVPRLDSFPMNQKQEAQRATYRAPEYNMPPFWGIRQGGHLVFLIGPKNTKLGRGRWDLASCQVSLNSVQWFQRRSRKCEKLTTDRRWTDGRAFIPYIYNVSIKDPISNSPRKVINSNFSYIWTHLTLFDVNHCVCDLANWWTTLWLYSSGIEPNIFAWFYEGNIIPL